MKKKSPLLISLCLFLIISCNKPEEIRKVNIIPAPMEIKTKPGVFEITENVIILYSEKTKAEQIADFMVTELKKYSFNLKTERLSDNSDNSNAIVFQINQGAGTGEEGYKLSVTEDKVHIIAENPAGLFYGFQTIKQMLPADYKEKPALPYVEINDSPQLKWRGMHLDVSRHFMPKEFVKKYIDYLAAMKMNTFHWHLTDDQGWRIEIKAYPKLTEAGAWRDETLIGHGAAETNEHDGIKHGGFYSQEEIKEIVKYAEERYINIVPEIEMPGHAQAAIAAYPFLGCTNDPVKVWTRWGVSPYIYNVEDTTFKFLETVLTEVIDLFPGKYIHIGGDEAIKPQWIESKEVNNKIKELGLKGTHELQSYFIKRMEKFIN
ncbi:MAG: family 20 glycosylhydrolase, partial [bacterium]|nr:family 20 glycosylhydrolase [bacterium]